MKHTEEQINKLAKKIIEDVEWTYEEGSFASTFHDLEEQVERMSSQKDHPRFQEYIETLFPYWSVTLDFLEAEGWKGRNIMFVYINDETGEPYKIGHRQFIGGLQKNSNGKYEITERNS